MGYRDSNQDVPDPGTSNGRPDRMVLRCVDCAWMVSSPSAADAVRAGADHAATGHRVAYRGTVQDFSRVVAA